MRIIDFFDKGAALYPENIAFQDASSRYSYRQASQQTHLIASALHGMEFGNGTHIGILAPNSSIAFLALLGVFRVGAVWLPINPRNPVAINAYRLLAITGCRRGEIFGLRKSEVDDHRQCFRLGDTKTGRQVRAIGREALELLNAHDSDVESGYVFPATHIDGHLTDAKLFRSICDDANLSGVSLHTLRHSFASVALELEYSELTIAGLLGHKVHSITSRYAHHVDRALVAAADRVSSLIMARMTVAGLREGEVDLRRA